MNLEVKVRLEHKSKAPVSVDVVGASLGLNENCSDDDHNTDVGKEVEELQKRLKKLQIRENNARKRVMVTDLRRQLEEKEKTIFTLEESIHFVCPSRTIDGRETRERGILDVDSRRAQSVTCKDTRRMSPQSLETPLNSILSDAGRDGRLPNSNLSFGNWPDNLAGPVSLSQASGVVVDTKTRPRPVGESVAHPQMTNITDATDMATHLPVVRINLCLFRILYLK